MKSEKGFISFDDPFIEELPDDFRDEVEYWEPLSKLIIDFITLRYEKGLTQSEIAEKMKTRQSVISRFENSGRKPNYDFLVRLASALGGQLGITLDADNTISIPKEYREKLSVIVEETGIDRERLVSQALVFGLENTIRERRQLDSWGRLEDSFASSGWMTSPDSISCGGADVKDLRSLIFDDSASTTSVPVSIPYSGMNQECNDPSYMQKDVVAI